MILICGVAGNSPRNTHQNWSLSTHEASRKRARLNETFRSIYIDYLLGDAGERGNNLARSQPLQLFAVHFDFSNLNHFSPFQLSHGWIGWNWGSADWIRPFMQAIIVSLAQEEGWHTQTIPDDSSTWLNNAIMMPSALLIKATMVMWKWFIRRQLNMDVNWILAFPFLFCNFCCWFHCHGMPLQNAEHFQQWNFSSMLWSACRRVFVSGRLGRLFSESSNGQHPTGFQQQLEKKNLPNSRPFRWHEWLCDHFTWSPPPSWRSSSVSG